MSTQLKITGAKEISKILKQFPDEVAEKAEKMVVKSGAAPIARKAKSLAPKGEQGLLKKSTGSNLKKSKGVWSARIGARSGFRTAVTTKDGKVKMLNPAKYQHIVHGGSKKMRPDEYIYDAVHATRDKAVAAMANRLDKALDQTIKRLRRRYERIGR